MEKMYSRFEENPCRVNVNLDGYANSKEKLLFNNICSEKRDMKFCPSKIKVGYENFSRRLQNIAQRAYLLPWSEQSKADCMKK